ncbi:NUDIX domain-containing protein [Maribius pontilimi]|uniref:NUDIX domain-containing protein n=1 Tax=Palleronia pontilimi TaxID=1964209 RepID=A0A934MB53_9RHOB|nr:NUDIX domain-containing protein [Palleronia pontilimi]
MTGGFNGAKGAIIARGGVVTLLRDAQPGLAWSGCWDLPGGAREGGESAWACFARETLEETGLVLDRRALRWCRAHMVAGRHVVFFGVVMPGLRAGDLRLGDEGQALALMPLGRFLAHPKAIAALKPRVGAFCRALARRGICV